MDDSRNNAQSRNRFLYGRRKGRPLSPQQAAQLDALLPQLRLNLDSAPQKDLANLFQVSVQDIWLEIGFGAGEHLLYQAEAYPNIGFIGCEPFLTGVAKVVHGIIASSLQNIRLYDDDANHVLDWLPKASIGRIFILFPDPWPKRRHRKRRFLTGEGLARLARIMKPGAELRFATDIADYADMVQEGIGASTGFASKPGMLPERPEDWPLTRYGEKAEAAGRHCQFFTFTRI